MAYFLFMKNLIIAYSDNTILIDINAKKIKSFIIDS